ncbi:hypothetical protein MPH_01639 [Macrophomina phaseolina MS6]|uniref:Uncharacterized protein n=1 Tax=Macrophomina phaseolina (strain MS6) TaxID=1126212 RepID=K2SWV2_MACPH|nr:hypothetical protein MPH_01639 [Macrophomina phaseolina MS6]
MGIAARAYVQFSILTLDDDSRTSVPRLGASLALANFMTGSSSSTSSFILLSTGTAIAGNTRHQPALDSPHCGENGCGRIRPHGSLTTFADDEDGSVAGPNPIGSSSMRCKYRTGVVGAMFPGSSSSSSRADHAVGG